MKQLIQNYKTSDLYFGDVPMPSISIGFVLVVNIPDNVSFEEANSTRIYYIT